MSSHLENLGSSISIPIEPDAEGYIGRECPQEDCLGYFKVRPGTGILEPAPCHCPYCGHVGDGNTFYTREQIEYAKSVAFRRIADAFHQDLKGLEFERKPQGAFGIGFSLKVERSSPVPIRHYREKQLETKIICDGCTLDYTIYGVFGWCPDCGAHNSFQILTKNLELARRQLALAKDVDHDLAEHLIGDALENVVSAFDGFGRELCSQRGLDIRFQNIEAARKKVIAAKGSDFADSISSDDWEAVCRVFQKRHVLSHKMGVMDEEYVQKVRDPTAIAGRRVKIIPDEVARAASLCEKLGKRLFDILFAADNLITK